MVDNRIFNRLESRDRSHAVIALISLLASIAFISLPGSQVRSAGSGFASFSEAWQETSVWIFVSAQFLIYGSLVYRGFSKSESVESFTTIRMQNLSLSIFGGFYTFWVGYGITARASNTRIHWVDCPNGLCGDDLRYWAIRWLNSNEFLNLNPNVTQGIIFGTILFIFLTIITDFTEAKVWRLSAFVSLVFGAPLAVFLQPGEDTALGVLAIALATYLVRRGGLLWLSIAGFLPTLVRPQFVVYLLAAGVAAFCQQSGELRSAVRGRIYSAFGVMSMSLMWFCAYQFIILESVGDRWFLKSGEGIFDTSATDNAPPIEVDGFTISFLSGTFLGHLLWICPILIFLPWLLLRVIGTANVYQFEGASKSVLVFMVAGGSLTVLLLEAFPLLYFNVRYLTFAAVPLIVSAIVLLGMICEKSSWWKRLERDPVRWLTAAVVIGGSLATVTPIHGLSPSSRMSFDASAVGELWDHRETLRSLSKEHDVVVFSKSKSDFNMASYFAGRRVSKVSVVSEIATNTLVFCPRPCEVDGSELVASSSFSVVLSDD